MDEIILIIVICFLKTRQFGIKESALLRHAAATSYTELTLKTIAKGYSLNSYISSIHS